MNPQQEQAAVPHPAAGGTEPRSAAKHRARAEALVQLAVLMAAWILISSWALIFPADVEVEQARLNEALVGMGAFLAAVRRRHHPFGRLPAAALTLGLGVWLVVAPFVVGYGQSGSNDIARVNDVVSGALLALIAAASLVLARRHGTEGQRSADGASGSSR
ncbi:SPW repeat protein [Streptomyces monticola]|uniref:SPW repeat protein n=1 Tax=Streptomyces monticola TaxID=2666263 RepID=A0ABW2JUY5_9ACTN